MKVELRGGNLELLKSKVHECVNSGPSETGKTWAACIKAHTICSMVPGAQGAMIRKTAASLTGTVVRTFNRIIKNSPVRAFGGETPSRYIYPNGSTIWLGGMDNPNRVLSAERDFIYVCQAEELTLNDWEMLVTRCTGRGAKVQDPQLFGDCNPAGSMHWIRQREKEGKLQLLKTTHKDNPTLYDKDGWITEQGKRSLAALRNLTGIRRKRLLEGIWATAEGAVYDNFDPTFHVCVKDPNEFVRFYLAMDEGFTNPQVILLVGADGDNRWHVFKEYYVTGQLEVTIVAQAKLWFSNVRNALKELRGTSPVRCELCSVDNAAPGLIAALNEAGIYAIGGKGALTDSAYNSARGRISGLDKIRDRLAVQKDGKPRLTIDPSCVNMQNEFESYVYKEGKDEPEKEYDHCLIAGTLITTKRGQIPIEKVLIGDLVLTRQGWKPVTFSGITGRTNKLITLVSKDRKTITGTPEHKVWTENRGFICLRDIMQFDTLMTCQDKKQSFGLMGLSFAEVQKQKCGVIGFITQPLINTGNKIFDTYIGKSGKVKMVQFLKDMRFITKIITHLITSVTILNVCLRQNIRNIMQSCYQNGKENGLGIWLTEYDHWQLTGIQQRKERLSIEKMVTKYGEVQNYAARFVNVVMGFLSIEPCTIGLNFVLINVRFVLEKQQESIMCKEDVRDVGNCFTPININLLDFVPQRVLHTTQLEYETQNVYDLTVEEVNEFFANGILVHNCMDAVRYLADVLVQPTGAFVSASQIIKTDSPFERMEIDTERIRFDE